MLLLRLLRHVVDRFAESFVKPIHKYCVVLLELRACVRLHFLQLAIDLALVLFQEGAEELVIDVRRTLLPT